MKNKIFIVEDDLLLTRLYKRAFEMAGYEVDSAGDGDTALEKLKEMAVKPRVILLDILMPRRNGIDVLRDIKNMPGLKNIPVIIFTNVPREEGEKEAIRLGAAMYLLKGEMDISDIVSRADSLIEK